MNRKKRKSIKTAGENSPLWRKKADTLFSDQQRALVCKCEVCDKPGKPRKDGLMVVGLDLHHLIGRSRPRFRYDPNNAIVLCKSHHGSHPNFRNRTLCAHGSTDTADAFVEWLKQTKPKQYEWYEKNKSNKRLDNKTFIEYCLELKGK